MIFKEMDFYSLEFTSSCWFYEKCILAFFAFFTTYTKGITEITKFLWQ